MHRVLRCRENDSSVKYRHVFNNFAVALDGNADAIVGEGNLLMSPARKRVTNHRVVLAVFGIESWALNWNVCASRGTPCRLGAAGLRLQHSTIQGSPHKCEPETLLLCYHFRRRGKGRVVTRTAHIGEHYRLARVLHLLNKGFFV